MRYPYSIWGLLMKTLIIGSLAVLFGVAGFSYYFFNFLGIIAGALPVLLILGGALAAYLGYTDIRDSGNDDFSHIDEARPTPSRPEHMPTPEDSDDTAPRETSTMNEKHVETGNEAPAASESLTPENTSSTEEKAKGVNAPFTYKGNKETLVFHKVSCKFSQGKNCTAVFNNREAALEQGYSPCKICNP